MVGRDLKVQPVPPPCRGRDNFCQLRLFQALSSLVLDTSRDEESSGESIPVPHQLHREEIHPSSPS